MLGQGYKYDPVQMLKTEHLKVFLKYMQILFNTVISSLNNIV